MSTMSTPTSGSTLPPTKLWAVTSRTIVFGAVGAALYGVLGIFSFVIPGTLIEIRPAIALVPFIGLRFGPLAGLFAGAVGNAIIDQIHGYGFLTYWNWSLANGCIGLVAGILAHLWSDPRPAGAQLIRTAVLSAISVVVGMVFTITDLLLGTTFVGWLASYGLAVLASGIIALILTTALDRVWKPLQNLTGR